MSDYQNSTFERCPHDAENPFVMVSRALIRDKSLSPECRWLLIYLLSHSNNWKIHIREVVNHCEGQIGRDRVYELVNEAIDAGYLKREEILVRGLMRIKYVISEVPKFKKCLRRPENQDAENPDAENQDDKEEQRKEEKEKEEKIYQKDCNPEKIEVKPERGDPPKPPSADADLLSSFFLSKMKERKPDFMGVVSKSWKKSSERLLKKRSPERIREVIDWVFEHEFWSSVILCPSSLLKNFDRIEIQMSQKKPGMRTDENRQIAERVKEKFLYHPDVDVCSDYIGFKFGPQKYVSIRYDENGFKEQVENNLRKLGLYFIC